MSCMSHNFRLFYVSNLSVRNFRIFLLMYLGSLLTSLPIAVTPPEHFMTEIRSCPTAVCIYMGWKV